MKRNKQPNHTQHLSLTQASQLTKDKGAFHEYCTSYWQHLYNDRLAWKYIKDCQDEDIFFAQFAMLFIKRGIRDVPFIKKAVNYYRARAMMRLANSHTKKVS